MFYDKYVLLCNEKNISPSKAAIEVGLNKSTITYWKNSGKTPNGETLQKLSNYFGVTVDNLLGKEDNQKTPDLTNKDRRDIAKDLEKMMKDLKSSGDLMFDGDPASPEALESIRNALAMGLEYAKKVNKEKYTLNSYPEDRTYLYPFSNLKASYSPFT